MDLIKAFLVGGAFCVAGQILIDKTKLTPARILVSYVVIGVLLGAVGVYQPLVDFAGAGATVPLTGFGNTLAKGVKEAVDKDGFIGIFTGGLTAAAGGIAAAVVAGLLMSLLFRAKDKSQIPGHSNTAESRTDINNGGIHMNNQNKNQNQQNQQNKQNKQNQNSNQNQQRQNNH